MKPYAFQGTGHRCHPHNKCDIASGEPRNKKITRQKAKYEIREEIRNDEDTRDTYKCTEEKRSKRKYRL